MKPAFKLGLRGRLFLLLLTAFTALAGVIVAHSLHDRRTMISAASEQLRGQAKLLAVRQQYLLAQGEALLNGLMLQPELHTGGAACSRLLAERLKHYAEFINIGMVLADGTLACSAVPVSGPINFADRYWFQQAHQTSEMVLGDVVAGRIVGTRVLSFARVIRDGAGQLTGVLYVSLEIAWLERELVKGQFPQGAKLMVVDEQGLVALRQPDPEGWTGRSIAHLPLFKHLQADGGEGTQEETGLDGERQLYTHVPLLATASGHNYQLLLGVPKAAIVADAQRELTVNLAFALLIFAGVLALVVVGGNRLVLRPLLALSRATTRFGAGDLAARSGLPHTDDEVGRLAKTLDEVAATIEDKERRLQQVNRALRVQSAGNQTLLRAKGEQELLEKMCRAIVEAGGYRLAWVGCVETGGDKSVRPVAASGEAVNDFLSGLKISWDGTAESGRGPTGTAIRLGMAVAANQVETDPDYGPWRERAQRHGYAASLALPLRIDSAVTGALNLYAAEPDTFGEEEVKLLSEVADDLAFGIAQQRAAVEHRRTQAALKTSEDLFHAAANASLDALLILRAVRGADEVITDFELTDLNVRAEQLLGLVRGLAIGHKLGELLPWVRTQGRLDLYAAVVSTGTPLDEEFAVDAPAIKAQWLRQQAVRMNDGIALSMRDITSWKEAGAALRASEVRFRNLVETSNDWVWAVDENAAYTYASPQVLALLGYRPEEVLGKTIFDLMPAEEAQRVAALFGAHVAAREAIVNLENVNLHKAGHRVVLETSGVPVIDPDGKFRGYRGIDRDISERKQHEVQIIRLNRALRTLSTCNATLVHAETEMELLQEVCLTIVETGGYQLAWVEYPVGSEVTWYGDEAMYRLHSELASKPEHDRLCLSAIALRTHQTQLCDNLQEMPASHFSPLHAAGVQSVLALPLRQNGDSHGVLTIFSSTPDAFDADEVKLMEELAADLAYGIVTLRTRAERDRITYAHVHHAEILQKSLEQSIQAIADTVEARDPYTAGHQRRVSELAVAIARELSLAEERIHGLRLAATIHDLGKVHIPAEYLSKPSKLTDTEFTIIKTHPQSGYYILKGIEFPWPIADIVHQHHERLDGSGYPQGLKGGQILLESRILAVADVVEAMSSHRPYRPSLGIEVALQEIERGRGSAYDAAIVDACLKLFREGRFAFQG